MLLEEKHYYDPLTSLKLFTEGEDFDDKTWWKIEYNCDKKGKILSEKNRVLFRGKPPLYVPRQITYMPAVKRAITNNKPVLEVNETV